MAGREQIANKLFALLSKSATFKTMSRRNRDPEGLDPSETPALFLVENEDKWDRSSGFNIPAIRAMNLVAIIYTDCGPDQNAIPSSFINDTLDAIEAAMVPDDQQTGAFTLGGLVQSCDIDGLSQRASGDVTGKALAVVPIRILIP